MLRTTSLRALAVSLLVSSTAFAADKWENLKPGMTRAEAAAVLGTELVASSGRGFEIAIYEDKAEVVYLRGQVVAWTAPSASKVQQSPANAWQFDQVSRVRSTASAAARAVEKRPANGPILPAYRL